MINRASAFALLLTVTVAAAIGQAATPAGTAWAGARNAAANSATPAAAAVKARPVDAWTQAGAHATGDHFNPGEHWLTPATAARLKPLWTVPAPAAVCDPAATPLIGSGRLVTAAGYRISAYDEITGQVAWQTPVARKSTITLAAIVGSRLIAQYRDCHSSSSTITALDLRTGKVIYRKPTSGMMYQFVVDQGVLLGGFWDAAVSEYALRAYRVSDGAPLWYRVGSFSGDDIAAGGRVLVEDADGPDAAVDITTGRTLWSLAADCFSAFGASTDGSRFYLRCRDDDRTRLVDAATGATITTLPDYGWHTFFATDGTRIYLNGDSGLIAADATDGHRIWRRPFPDGTPYELALAGGVLYALRGDGKPMQAFDARTGKLIALDARTATVTMQPMVAGGRLYGVTRTGVAAFTR
jgi:outer membrane protein assembly factor BamB